MIKKIKLNNLGWILSGILFLILALITGKNKNPNKVVKVEEKKMEISVMPTKILEATTSADLVEVTKVIDGDTIMVKLREKEEAVRLIGIDTPETKDPRKPVQCFGEEAAKRTKELVQGKRVKLEADVSQNDRDKYNRLLRYVYLENGNLINKLLIQEGFGFEYTYQIPYKFQTEFKMAQKEAESKKTGMWAEGVCITPTPTKTETNRQVQGMETTVVPTQVSNSGFVCDCSKSCTKISSCEEAYFQLNNCGCTVRDNDGDGVPCESLCR